MILFHEKDCIVQIPFGKRALCTKMATDETADKDRRAYKVPIPGNKSVVVTYGYPLLLGVTQMADGYNFAVEAEEDSEVYLLLYRKRGREPFYELLLDEKYRTGRIFSVFMKKLNVTNLEYNFKINGEIYLDPCASRISGREHFGAAWEEDPHKVRCGFWSGNGYDWGDEKAPETDFGDMILYKVHVRGYTRQAKLPTGLRGTFSGLVQMIPYWQELGINTVELMPAYEFMEVVPPKEPDGLVSQKGKKDEVNYWGYGNGLYFAPKSAYCATRDPHREFCDMIRAFHKAGIGCIMEMYFPAEVNPLMALRAVQFWKQNYHVDGFHLLGFPNLLLAAEDPFLKRTKLFAENWNEVMDRRPKKGYITPGDGPVSVAEKNLAEYNMQFMEDMRRFLKGDEGMLQAFEFRNRRNPAEYAVVNYMANTNGFTLMDAVSYDRKHNEKNGEENRDGSDYNYSWNCGAEGPTRKKKIVELRKQLIKNAYLLLFLSQGVPLLMAGDEFGNSQDGNNNAYCQDNAVSWLNWKLLETHMDQVEFVKRLIAFRKSHKMFHMDREPRIMDYKSCGRPDVSYHGENAWKPEFENFRRQFGILYWGAYAKKPDGTDDANFYVLYNMHWEPHMFGLPHLPKGAKWHVICSTADPDVEDLPSDGTGEVLKNQMMLAVPPRGIMILESVADPDSGKETKKGKSGSKKEKNEKTDLVEKSCEKEEKSTPENGKEL